jgi:hypothetical protein
VGSGPSAHAGRRLWGVREAPRSLAGLRPTRAEQGVAVEGVLGRGPAGVARLHQAWDTPQTIEGPWWRLS